jgi:hypothetical protein
MALLLVACRSCLRVSTSVSAQHLRWREDVGTHLEEPPPWRR